MALRRWCLLLAAAACGAVAQTVAAWGTERWSFLAALAVFALGGWSLWRLSRARPGAVVAAGPIRPRRETQRAKRALLLATSLFTVLAAAYVGELLSWIQLAAYAAALASVIGFALALDRDRVASAAAPRWSRGEIARLVALTGLAFAVRLWRLDTLPPAIWDDEILYLHDAIVYFGEQGLPSPFASGTWGAPYLHAYTIAAAATWIDDRAVALRLVSAVPGALAVPFLYLAMRELFDRRFAFFAALLLALSAWSLILSRHGYVWAINGFVEAGALWALARGLRRDRHVDFALCGLFLALGVIYSYAATLMPLVVVLFAVVQLLSDRPAAWARRSGFAVLVLVAMVAAAPRLSAMLANPEMRGYQERALWRGDEETSALGVLVVQLEQIAVSFNRRADNNPLFVPAPKEPLLDPITAAAFGLGFFWALFSWRRAGAQLLLLTFLVMLLPSAIGLSSTEWASGWRACGVLPGLFGLAAVPFALALATPASAAGRAFVGALLAAAITLVACINFHTYFLRHPTKLGWFRGANAQRMRAVDRVLGTPPGERLLLNFDLESDYMRALVRGRRSYELFIWPEDDALPAFTAGGARTTVLAGSEAYWEDDLGAGAFLGDLLQHYYPGGLREEERDAGGKSMLAAYVLDPSQIAAGHGLAQQVTGDGSFAATGTLHAPRDATYRFAVDGGEEVRIAVDGRAFSGGFVARGLHAISIHSRQSPAGLQWSIDGGELEPVPASALLRRDLPAWGFVESGHAVSQRSAWQRWVPVLWSAAPERPFGSTGDAAVEWSGAIELPPGDYTLLLRASAPTSVRLDGALVLEDLAWPDWRRVPVSVAPGRHRIEVRAEPPIEHRDMQLFWIDSSDRPGLFGGPSSSWR